MKRLRGRLAALAFRAGARGDRALDRSEELRGRRLAGMAELETLKASVRSWWRSRPW